MGYIAYILYLGDSSEFDRFFRKFKKSCIADMVSEQVGFIDWTYEDELGIHSGLWVLLTVDDSACGMDYLCSRYIVKCLEEVPHHNGVITGATYLNTEDRKDLLNFTKRYWHFLPFPTN